VLDASQTLTKLEGSKNFDSEEYRQLYWAELILDNLDNMNKYLGDKYGDYSKVKIENETARKDITRIRKWQSFNLGEYDAYRVILKNQNLFNQVSGLLQKANDFGSFRVSDTVRSSAPLDRATQPPLL
jgi:hypothetical protein